MAFVLVVVGGLVFGALDQYFGTLSAANALGWWTISVSLLSAPWLIVAFFAGWTQVRPQRAAVAGFIVTISALIGYFIMTVSPIEGVHLTTTGLRGLLGANRLNEIGGMITGPVFGWFGSRWRTRRSWIAACLVTGALCFEPLAVMAAGRGGDRSDLVWTIEVVVGIAAGLWFVASVHRQRRLMFDTSSGSTQ
jgi:hypothetical protein